MLRYRVRIPRLGTNSLFLLILCFVFVLPISVFGAERGGFPIDLIPSDLLSAGVAFTYFFASAKYSSRETLLQVQIFFVLYGFVLACITVLQVNNLIPIFSFLKFSKVFLAFFAGYALARWNGRDNVLYALANAAALYIFLLVVSQFLYHADFTPRLGSHFFEFPIYGFPNSPSSYLVFLLCIALVKVRSNSIKWVLLLFAAVFAAGSLSRNALLLVTIAALVLSIDSPKRLMSSIGVIAIGSGAFLLFNLHDVLEFDRILGGVAQRFASAQQSSDFSNGRFDIFSEAFNLISLRPVFGYGFQSFSDFAYHGTPHNQYLEVLFKTGIVGSLFYLSILCIGIMRVSNFKNKLPNDLSVKGIYLMLWLVLLGSIAQPNLSYSATGNLVFFIFGLFAIMPVDAKAYSIIQKHQSQEISSNA